MVTHAAFITGRWLGDEVRDRLEAAAQRGGASLYGTGINPGFANIMAVVSTRLCATVDRVTLLGSVDSTYYDSWVTGVNVGFGRQQDAPGSSKARG